MTKTELLQKMRETHGKIILAQTHAETAACVMPHLVPVYAREKAELILVMESLHSTFLKQYGDTDDRVYWCS